MSDSLLTLISRRRLVTAMALSPLLWHMGTARAAKVDTHRVVALEWLPVELLLALGVVPYGVADIINYRLWVNEPALPDSVIDVGLRTEPNLELLTQMKPSLLVWSAGYGPSEETLRPIAPGRGFSFSDGKAPLTKARQSLLEMGELLGIEQKARDHLAAFDAWLEQMKPRFAERGNRPVLMLTLMDERHVLVIGKNSLFQQVMEVMNIPNAWQGETNFWGSAVVGIDRLAAVKDADVLCFEHGDDALMARIAATPLWNAMPFIRQQRFQRVPAVWFYGATLSAMHFGRVLDKALGGKA
ncbi:Fe(3+)-hydroxamate ABC transporter substrate-binding protein FhuD [Atlantibacter sp.]|uniref:Fe(3+)-hydroxamate ABC transporter substrate-binding protein FhuD n=1 Tax=Atlantibacter sp. TaxID=1903473 RepID=UPI00289A21A9|nr:Fe(3+)-hydroxamate ABC transporter substrate-binding protein FhuD [Atlantibacter sp.]